MISNQRKQKIFIGHLNESTLQIFPKPESPNLFTRK